MKTLFEIEQDIKWLENAKPSNRWDVDIYNKIQNHINELEDNLIKLDKGMELNKGTRLYYELLPVILDFESRFVDILSKFQYKFEYVEL